MGIATRRSSSQTDSTAAVLPPGEPSARVQFTTEAQRTQRKSRREAPLGSRGRGAQFQIRPRRRKTPLCVLCASVVIFTFARERALGSEFRGKAELDVFLDAV